tara:strand:+ start:1759 stop:4050 length:2292 start_codon:yes stop_codon:yes gene_type:complete
MDFNEILKLLREGQSPERVINNIWRSIAEEQNIENDSVAKELARQYVGTAQQVIASQEEGITPTEREQDERGAIIEGNVVTSEAQQVQEAIGRRGGGGVIYRDYDAIMELSEGARPYAGTSQEIDIKADLEAGKGWNPVLGTWYTKDEYLDDIRATTPLGASALFPVTKGAEKNWDNDKAVSINIIRQDNKGRPDTWKVQKITDLPTGEVPNVEGQAVTVAPTTDTTTVTPSAAATTITATGAAAATSDAAQPDTPTPSSVGGIINTGLDYTKLAELGITPSQQAAALPTMLQGGTSPFVARGYSNILQNYADIFPMLMIAGQVPGFGLDEGVEAGMLDESDMSTLANPKAFAAFINQKPEKIANDIKTTLALLESAKTANTADPEWALNNSTEIPGLLLEFFTNNPDQYNRIGGKELALRQTLGKMGKPRWLGDLISNQLETKYNKQLLIDPNKIAEAGFYKNAFANFTTGNTLLDTEVKTAGAAASMSGSSLTSADTKPFASSGKTSAQIQAEIDAASGQSSAQTQSKIDAAYTKFGNNLFNPSPDTNTPDAKTDAKTDTKTDTTTDPIKRFDPTSNINTGSEIEQDIPAGVTGTTLDNDKSSPTFGMMVTYEDGVKTSAYKIDMITGQKFMYNPMTGQLSSQQSGRINPNTGANIGVLGNPNRINTDIPVLGAGVNNMFQPYDPNINPVATGPAPTPARTAELIKLAGIPPNPNAALSSTEPSSPLNPNPNNLDLNKPKTIARREDIELDKFLEEGEWLY